ncbi:hypothetical protein [Billgrantia zhangzhouensis]|uniref:hypothetical protein n=1 Tax=Billgrantia zhangzhouensis TaxID=2733481 RepID=UPI001F3ED30F|nr:hypothetical protein [Halomonas zhangzhouensis]
MSWLHRVPMGMKFLLVLALPILAVVAFAAIDINERWRLMQDMEQVQQASVTVREATDLLARLTSERGVTATWLNTDDETYRSQLADRRSGVDRAREAFEREIAGLDRGSLDAITRREIDEALAGAGAARQHRRPAQPCRPGRHRRLRGAAGIQYDR